MNEAMHGKVAGKGVSRGCQEGMSVHGSVRKGGILTITALLKVDFGSRGHSRVPDFC